MQFHSIVMMTNQKCFPYSPLFRLIDLKKASRLYPLLSCFLPVLWTSHFTLLTLDTRCHSYVMSKHKRRCSNGKMVYRLASLLSLLGDGFMASFPGFPLAGVAAAAASAGSMATAAARLIGSSALDRSSGLGWEGGACSVVGGDVSSCCNLWVWRRRSWTRSSNMASCSSWMAWFRWVFLFCRETQQRQRLDWCIEFNE